MKIKYKQKRFYNHLFFGLVWMILGFLKILNFEKFHWTDIGYFLVGITYFGIYYYEKSNQYLTIENGKIRMNIPYSKKINLTDIKQINKFSGDYILKTEAIDLTINTDIIEPKSLQNLDVVLGKLKLSA